MMDAIDVLCFQLARSRRKYDVVRCASLRHCDLSRDWENISPVWRQKREPNSNDAFSNSNQWHTPPLRRNSNQFLVFK